MSLSCGVVQASWSPAGSSFIHFYLLYPPEHKMMVFDSTHQHGSFYLKEANMIPVLRNWRGESYKLEASLQHTARERAGKERERGWEKYTTPSDKSAARPRQWSPSPPQPSDPLRSIPSRKGGNTRVWNGCPSSSGYFFFLFLLVLQVPCTAFIFLTLQGLKKKTTKSECCSQHWMTTSGWSSNKDEQ